MKSILLETDLLPLELGMFDAFVVWPMQFEIRNCLDFCIRGCFYFPIFRLVTDPTLLDFLLQSHVVPLYEHFFLAR
jgi:hypothetical protein